MLNLKEFLDTTTENLNDSLIQPILNFLKEEIISTIIISIVFLAIIAGIIFRKPDLSKFYKKLKANEEKRVEAFLNNKKSTPPTERKEGTEK